MLKFFNPKMNLLIIIFCIVLFSILLFWLCSSPTFVQVHLLEPNINLKQYDNIYVTVRCNNFILSDYSEFFRNVSKPRWSREYETTDNIHSDFLKYPPTRLLDRVTYESYLNKKLKKEVNVKENSILLVDNYERGLCLPYGRPWSLECIYRKYVNILIIDFDKDKTIAELEFHGTFFTNGAINGITAEAHLRNAFDKAINSGENQFKAYINENGKLIPAK